MIENKVTLYNYFRSSASFRVRLGLHYKEVAFDYVPVHLVKNQGEQHSAKYKELNSLSQVPTLVHETANGTRVLAQSVAILEYLEEVFPSKPLLPKDAFKRAKVREFIETVNSLAQPMGNLGTLQYLESKLQFDSKMKADWVQFWNHKALTHLESLAETAQFCFQNQFSLADCFLLPQLFAAKRFQVDLSPFPKLLKIEENCLQLDFVKKAHPANQVDSE
ncbi:MAG: maleylacetoacetate isomerase [Pseudobdellovibrionaceae bacterium]